jgi:hypothetical protein
MMTAQTMIAPAKLKTKKKPKSRTLLPTLATRPSDRPPDQLKKAKRLAPSMRMVSSPFWGSGSWGASIRDPVPSEV